MALTSEDGREELRSEELDRFTKMARRMALNVSALEAVIGGETARLWVPTAEGAALPVVIHAIKNRGGMTHTLQGEVEGEPQTSLVQLVYHDGVMHGSVARYAQEQEIEYRVMADGYLMVRELDQSAMTEGCEEPGATPEGDEAASGAGGVGVQEGETAGDTAGYETVDVVVGYDQGARLADGGYSQMEARIIGSVDRMNLAFSNSAVTQTEVMLLGTVEDPDYVYPGAISGSMGGTDELGDLNITDSSNPALNTVSDYAALLGADLKAFVVTDSDGSAGVAYRPGNSSITARTYMTATRFTFAHELGHNFSARHSWGDTSGADAVTTVNNYGWRLAPAGQPRVRTIMAYDWSWGSGVRIPYYANPNVLYQGARTGQSNGYNATGDALSDSRYVSGGYVGGLGAGFDGSNPYLGAQNAQGLLASAAGRAALQTRTSLNVVTPALAVVWNAGDTEEVFWTGGDYSDSASLDLYKGGVWVENLVTGLRGDQRRFAWTISNNRVSGSDYMVRLTLNGSMTADSGLFEIVGNVLPMTLTLPALLSEAGPMQTGTVTVDSAPSSDVTVSLSSSDLSELTVPASVTIPAGTVSVDFDLSPQDDTLLDGAPTVEVSATAVGYAPTAAETRVADNEAAALVLSVPSVLDEGDLAVAGSVSVTVAPDEAVTVQLGTNDPSVAALPVEVVIPAGSTGPVAFMLDAPDNSLAQGNRTVNLSAEVPGWTPANEMLTVQDDDVVSLVLSGVTQVSESDGVFELMVTVNTPLSANLTISLASDDASEITLPATVEIPAGNLSAVFDATIVDDADFDGVQTVGLTATASGYPSGGCSVTVTDNDTHHLTLSAVPSPQWRFRGIPVQVTAKDVNDDVISNYGEALTWSGSGGISVYALVVAPFQNGTATFEITVQNEGTGLVLTAEDAGGASGATNAFDVQAAAFAGFQWTSIGNTVDLRYPVTVTAIDDAGLPATSYNEPTHLEVWSASIEDPIGATGGATTTLVRNTAVNKHRIQMLFTPEELGEARWLSRFGTYSSSSGAQAMENTTVRIKLTGRTSFGGEGFDATGWTTVFESASVTAATTSFNFKQPFWYDGTSSIIVDYSFSNASTGTAGSNYVIATPEVRTMYASADASEPDPLTWGGGVGPEAQTMIERPVVLFYRLNLLGELPGSPVTFTDGIWSGQVHTPNEGGFYCLARATTGETGFSDYRIGVTLAPTTSGNLVFSDSFANTVLSANWITGGTNNSRVRVTSSDDPKNSNHVILDCSPSGTLSRSEATLSLNLTGKSNGTLEFYAKEFADESHYPPSVVFDSDANFDGVAISPDGVQWVEARTLRGLLTAYSTSSTPNYRVSLDPIMKRFGWSYGPNFKIKWTQYDNSPTPSDGIAFDDVRVRANSASGVSLSMAPSSVLEGSAPFQVTLSAPVAVASDRTIYLTSGHTAKMAVPPSVVLPANQTSVNAIFTPQDDSFADGWKQARIQLTMSGVPTTYHWIAVEDDESAVMVTLDVPDTVEEFGGAESCRVRLSTPAPSLQNLVITSSDESELIVTGGLALSAGRTDAAITLTPVDDSFLDGSQTVTLTVLNLTSGASSQVQVTVLDDEQPELVLSLPTELVEGAGPLTASLDLGYSTVEDQLVELTTDNPSQVTLPASVTVPAGQRSISFSVEAGNDLVPENADLAEVTATVVGIGAVSQSMAVLDDDAASFSWSAVAGPVAGGVPFAVELTALDLNGSVQTHYRGPVPLLVLAGASSLECSPSSATLFVNGVWLGMMTVGEAGSGVKLRAEDASGAVGESNLFDVQIGAPDRLTVAAPQVAVADVPFPVTIRSVDANGGWDHGVTGEIMVQIAGLLSTDPSGMDFSSTEGILMASDTGRTQMLVKASEINAPPGNLRSLKWAVAGLTAGSQVYENLTIRLQSTVQTEAPVTWIDSNWTTVYSGSTTAFGGYLVMDFNQPFAWDGVSNLLVDVSFESSLPAAGGLVYGTSKAETRMIYAAGTPTPLTWSGTVPAASSSMILPNLTFGREALLLGSQSLMLVNGEAVTSVSVPGSWEAVQIWADGSNLTPPLTSGVASLSLEETPPLAVQPEIIFCDGFESGSFLPEWTITGTTTYRTQVTTANGPHGGTYHMVMDATDSTAYARNEATLSLDLVGKSGVRLRFWMKEFGDEDHAPPSSPFTGGADFDGVAISEDGVTWYEVQALRGTAISGAWREFVVDLDSDISAYGLSYNSSFKIRFNHYDNYPATTDGFAFDDVCVTATQLSPAVQVSLPTSVGEGSAVMGLVMLPAAAAQDTVVYLTSQKPARLGVPSQVVVPIGSNESSFALTAADDDLLSGDVQVEIGAGLEESVIAHKDSIVVVDDETVSSVGLSFSGVLDEGGFVNGRVEIQPVPAGPIEITLSSSIAEGLVFPPTVSIGSGTTSVDWEMYKPDNTVAFEPVETQIEASVGVVSDVQTLALTDNEVVVSLLVDVPATVAENASAVSGTVTLPNSWVTAVPQTVTLVSSLPGRLTVPTSVEMPAGAGSVTFALQPVDNATAEGTAQVTVTASLANGALGTNTIAVEDDDVHHFTLDLISPQVRNRPFGVTIRARNLEGVIVPYTGTVTLAGSESGSPLSVLPSSIGGFVGGVATAQVTVADFASAAVLSVLDSGSGAVGSSNVFAVGFGTVASLQWGTVPGLVYAGAPFDAALTALDAEGNVVSNFAQSVALSARDLQTSVRQIGSGTSSQALPFNGLFQDTRQQSIHLASEIGGPMQIVGLDLNVLSLPGTATHPNFKIRLKHTTLTNWTTGNFVWEGTGWTTVYSGSVTISSTGTLHFAFSQPFDYNGTDHLMVDFSSDRSVSDFQIQAAHTSRTYGRSMAYYTNSLYGSPEGWSGTTPSAFGSGLVPSLTFHSAALPVVPAVASGFVNGVWSGQVTVNDLGNQMVLDAQATALSATSESFVVAEAPVLSVVLPDEVTEGSGPISGEVNLSSPALMPIEVNLSSTLPGQAQPVQSSVTIGAGFSTAAFQLGIVDDAVPEDEQSVEIHAVAANLQETVKTVLIVDDDPASLSLTMPSGSRLVDQPFEVTVSARTPSGQVLRSMQGPIVFSAASGALPVGLTTSGALVLTNGEWQGQVAITEVASAVVLTADAAGLSASGSAFDVTLFGAPTAIEWDIQEGAKVGQPTPVTLRAVDAVGNTVLNFASSVALQVIQPTEEWIETGNQHYSSSLGLSGYRVASRMQVIYTPEELGGQRTLRRLGLYFPGTAGTTLQNFTIRLKHTPLRNYNDPESRQWETSGLQTVYSGSFVPGVSGWRDFDFNSTFAFNGQDSLLVDISFYNGTTGSASVFGYSAGFDYRRIFRESSVDEGSPLLWASTPTPSTNLGTPVMRFLSGSTVGITPSVTGAFVNGVWTGSLTFWQTHPAVVVRATGGGLTGRSSPVAVGTIPSPVLLPEPAFTGGTTNQIEGSNATGASSHEMQAAHTSAFDPVVSATSQPSVNRTFSSLADGETFFYRARGTGVTPPSESRLWVQQREEDFMGNTFEGTSGLTAVGDASLEVLSWYPSSYTETFEGGSSWSQTIFSSVGFFNSTVAELLIPTDGPNVTPPLPVNQGVDQVGTLGMGAMAWALTPNTSSNNFADGAIEGYFGFASDTLSGSAGLVLRGVGSSLSGYMARVSATSTGSKILGLYRLAGFSSYPISSSVSVGNATNQNVKLRLSTVGAEIRMRAWIVESNGTSIVETPVSFPGGVEEIVVIDYVVGSGRAGILSSVNTGVNNQIYVDDVTLTRYVPTYALTGNMISSLIDPPSVREWGTLQYSVINGGAGSSFSVDVLDAEGTVLLSDVADGASLAGLGAVPAIQLRANFAVATSAGPAPVLQEWSVKYEVMPDQPSKGPWSNVVSSTQDATGPVISTDVMDGVFTTGASLPLTGTAGDATAGVAEVRVNGALAGSGDAFAHWNYSLPGLVDGANSFTLTAVDAAVPPNETSMGFMVFRIADP
ncbi:MAG: hypothetical protein KDK99_09920, partial [Verrucomicrobiales bacterium]|nr:hypothetical protein [Verrucomicrobiales bacterium]